MTKRKHYSNEFKSKAVLCAIKREGENFQNIVMIDTEIITNF